MAKLVSKVTKVMFFYLGGKSIHHHNLQLKGNAKSGIFLMIMNQRNQKWNAILSNLQKEMNKHEEDVRMKLVDTKVS